jgi:hypothetical protein
MVILGQTRRPIRSFPKEKSLRDNNALRECIRAQGSIVGSAASVMPGIPSLSLPPAIAVRNVT